MAHLIPGNEEMNTPEPTATEKVNPGLSDLLNGIGYAPAPAPAPIVEAPSPAPAAPVSPAKSSGSTAGRSTAKPATGRTRKSKAGKLKSTRGDDSERKERTSFYSTSAEKRRIRMAAINADTTVSNIAITVMLDFIEKTYSCRSCGCRFTISSFTDQENSEYSATCCPSCGGSVDAIEF